VPSAGRCRSGQVDFSPLLLAPPHPTASQTTTPSYLPPKQEPGALFAADDVLRGVTTTAAGALPRRLVSTPLIATSQVGYQL